MRATSMTIDKIIVFFIIFRIFDYLIAKISIIFELCKKNRKKVMKKGAATAIGAAPYYIYINTLLFIAS